MTLSEMIRLWEREQIPADLGDDWTCESWADEKAKGFVIQYKQGAGGLHVGIYEEWVGYPDRLKAARICNGERVLIYDEEYNIHSDENKNHKKVKKLHRGVAQRLQYVLGY